MVAPSVPESNLSQRRQRCQNVVPKRRAPRNPTQPRVVRTFAAVMWGERQQTRRCPTSHWCSLRNAGNWLCAGRWRWLAVAVTVAVTVAVDVVALLQCKPPLPAPVGPLIVAPGPSTAVAKPADRQLPCCLALSPRPLCPPAPCVVHTVTLVHTAVGPHARAERQHERPGCHAARVYARKLLRPR